MTWTEALWGLRGHTSVGEGIWPEEPVCCADVVAGFSWSGLQLRMTSLVTLIPHTKFPAPVYREMLSSAAGIGEPP